MRVTIVEAGGLAGAERVVARLDTDDLDPEAAQRVRELVLQLEAAGEVGADLPGHRVEVEEDGEDAHRSFTVVNDGTAPAPPALDELRTLGGPG